MYRVPHPAIGLTLDLTLPQFTILGHDIPVTWFDAIMRMAASDPALRPRELRPVKAQFLTRSLDDVRIKDFP